MKKTILLFGFAAIAFVANAQDAKAVDPHAGHNHAKVEAKPAKEVAAISPSTEVVKTVPVVLAETLATKETEFDFGKIPQGKPVTHVFTVTNTGKTPFKLDNVQASCGCTTPQWDKEKVIAPGTTAEITVGYNAAAEGVFTKPVTITYNGTQTKVLNIKGEVWKTPVTSAPTNGELNDIKN
jgi:Protein of unknown function (DUF1573)